MPSFDIVKQCDIDKTYRVARIMGDYDVKTDHAKEHFTGSIDLPDDWQIGVIWGGSGTGKTTIARELFGDQLIDGFEYTAKSVVDDMPKQCNMEEIEKMFYAVGFGSVPSWMKPYSVLSGGEKMRVDLARALLESDFVVFDEFTSVVDRQVAQTASLAISKAIRRTQKRFIAVSCHSDIIEWLEPDWVFDTNEMTGFFAKADVLKNRSRLGNVGGMNGKSLGVITI